MNHMEELDYKSRKRWAQKLKFEKTKVKTLSIADIILPLTN
jgi:hypothetical protein